MCWQNQFFPLLLITNKTTFPLPSSVKTFSFFSVFLDFWISLVPYRLFLCTKSIMRIEIRWWYLSYRVLCVLKKQHCQKRTYNLFKTVMAKATSTWVTKSTEAVKIMSMGIQEWERKGGRRWIKILKLLLFYDFSFFLFFVFELDPPIN